MADLRQRQRAHVQGGTSHMQGGMSHMQGGMSHVQGGTSSRMQGGMSHMQGGTSSHVLGGTSHVQGGITLPQPLPSQLPPTNSQGPAGGPRPEVQISTDMGSPRYARGVGPHVDKYMLKEKEEKKKRHLEHVVS